jgi:hypothetical protein
MEFLYSRNRLNVAGACEKQRHRDSHSVFHFKAGLGALGVGAPVGRMLCSLDDLLGQGRRVTDVVALRALASEEVEFPRSVACGGACLAALPWGRAGRAGCAVGVRVLLSGACARACHAVSAPAWGRVGGGDGVWVAQRARKAGHDGCDSVVVAPRAGRAASTRLGLCTRAPARLRGACGDGANGRLRKKRGLTARRFARESGERAYEIASAKDE